MEWGLFSALLDKQYTAYGTACDGSSSNVHWCTAGRNIQGQLQSIRAGGLDEIFRDGFKASGRAG